MATIRIADHYIPQVYDTAVGQMADQLYGLLASGAVVSDAQLNAFLAGPGQSLALPMFQALDSLGNSNVSSDDPAVLATTKKISSVPQNIPRIARNDWFAESDFAASLATVSGLEVVMNRLGDSASKSRQGCILAMLNGVFGTALAGNVLDVSIEDGDAATSANRFNIDTFADAVADIFDGRYEGDEVIIAHPKVVAQMQKEMGSAKTTININGLEIAVKTYAQHSYFLDRQVPVVAGLTSGFKYTTYVLKPGAIVAGSAGLSTVMDDTPLAGNGSGVTQIGWREQKAYSIPGVSYTGPANPTNANLADADNWAVISTVTDLSKMGVGAIITN